MLEDKITSCYDVRMLFEYTEVLHRPKFKFSKLEIIALIDFIKDNGLLTIAHKYPHNLKDPEDFPFLEVALGCQAEFLITGNSAHFPRKIGVTRIVSPSAFVKKFFNA